MNAKDYSLNTFPNEPMTKSNDFHRLLSLYSNDRTQLYQVMTRMTKVEILRFVEWGQDRVDIREIIKILQK